MTLKAEIRRLIALADHWRAMLFDRDEFDLDDRRGDDL